MKNIFLGFNGVLHSTNSKALEFELVPLFAQYLGPYANKFKIVISSSWRQNHSLEFLINIFPPSIKRTINGITPTHLNDLSAQGRYNEIKDYCNACSIKNNEWIAVDDNPTLFPPQCQNLVLVNSIKGVTEKELARIVAFVA